MYSIGVHGRIARLAMSEGIAHICSHHAWSALAKLHIMSPSLMIMNSRTFTVIRRVMMFDAVQRALILSVEIAMYNSFPFPYEYYSSPYNHASQVGEMGDIVIYLAEAERKFQECVP